MFQRFFMTKILTVCLLFVFSLSLHASIALEKVGSYGGAVYDTKFIDNVIYTATSNGIEVYDLATQNSTLPIATISSDVAILGLTISENYLFAAKDSNGVSIFDISDPKNPILLGELEIDGSVNSVVIDGDFAYLAAGESGLIILDISDPKNPFIEGRFNTQGFAYDLAVRGNYAYVADGGYGLQIINISILSKPYLRENLKLSSEARGVFVKDNYAYIANGTQGLTVVDISKAYQTTVKSNFSLQGYTYKVKLDQEYAYITTSNGIEILDIADLSQIRHLGSLATQGTAYNMDIYFSTAYLAAGESGLQVIDISDIRHLTVMQTYNVTSSAQKIIKRGNYAYIIDTFSGVQIMDVSNPAKPQFEGKISVKGTIQAMNLSLNHLYLGDDNGNLYIFDVTDTTKPSLISSIKTESAIRALEVSDERMFVARDDKGVKIYNVADPENPFEEGEIFTKGIVYSLKTYRNYIYVADGNNGLQIIDISNPNTPFVEGFIDTIGDAFDLAIRDGYAYVCDGKMGLQVFDVSIPSRPHLAANFRTKGTLLSIEIKGNFAYLGENDQGIEVVDISDIAHLKLVGSSETRGLTKDLYADDYYIYVANETLGLQVFKITSSSSVPNGFAATAVGADAVHLSWEDQALSENGFYLIRREGSSFEIIASLDPNTIEYVDTGLKPGTTYSYELVQIGEFGLSKTFYSNAVTTFSADRPAAPENLKAQANDDKSITVTWQDQANNETGFYLFRKTPESDWSLISTLAENKTSYTDTEVATETAYTYKLEAFNDDGISGSAISNTVTLTDNNNNDDADSVPDAPKNLNAAAVGTDAAALSWEDHSDNETGFYLFRKTGDGAWSLISTLEENITSYTDTNVETETAYTYKLEAFNDQGSSESVVSNVIILTAENNDSAPAAPKNVKGNATGSDTIVVSWEDHANNETGFSISRKEDGQQWEIIEIVTSNTTEYRDTGLKPATTYYYEVTAVNEYGISESVVSPAVKTSGEEDTIAPKNFKAALTEDLNVQLTWEDVSSNENGFYITRKDTNGKLVVIGYCPPNTTAYIDKTVEQGATYTYYISAFYQSHGLSNWAQSNEITVKDDTPTSTVPSNLTAVYTDDGHVELTWEDNSNNELGFYILREESDNGWIVIGIVDFDETSYTDNSSLEAGKKYRYGISAVFYEGLSERALSEYITVP